MAPNKPVQKGSKRTDRNHVTAHLDAPVTRSRFMDAARAKALAKLDIKTIRDLIRHVPFRYLDMSEVQTLREARIGSEGTVVGRIHEIVVHKTPGRYRSSRKTRTEITIFDGTGILIGVWFSQPWVAERFQVGERVAFSGKITHEYGTKRINSPFVEKLSSDSADDDKVGRILPVHPATEGLSTNWMRRLIAAALDAHHGIIDHLPPSVRIRKNLMNLDTAYRAIHFPVDLTQRDLARFRFAYEELFMLQLYLGIRKQLLSYNVAGKSHLVGGEHLNRLKDNLPFTLTDEQEVAVEELLVDMAREEPMNRMLLGDVGTGKTIVAAHALAVVADSGTQAAMMAPTEVLAQQYGEKIGPLLTEANISWALLTGSTPAKERADILAKVASNRIAVLFGTHALLEKSVEFEELTLAIVDEQHRFGVNQRAGLREKGKGVDLLVMTATPIPRTLALTVYGDLDCSYLRNRPLNQTAIKTIVESKHNSGKAYELVRGEVEQGRQAYIVCPLVGVLRGRDDEDADDVIRKLGDGTDQSELKAAKSHAALLQNKIFPEFTVGLLTGRMKPAEKAKTMEEFRSGKIQILVSTTVIEVGVDVPNATVMIVEDAERFGLSQLHQLRGRVGRGEHPGTFIVFADTGKPEPKARMKALERTSDGFELAEYDLQLRKEGDILGSRQHGMPMLRFTNVLADRDLIEMTRSDARALLENDPLLQLPQHGLLLHELKREYQEVWGLN